MEKVGLLPSLLLWPRALQSVECPFCLGYSNLKSCVAALFADVALGFGDFPKVIQPRAIVIWAEVKVRAVR